MADDRTFQFNEDTQGLQGDAIIELIELNLGDSIVNPIQDSVYLCNWVQTEGRTVKFGGISYLPIPYKADGFKIQMKEYHQTQPSQLPTSV